MTTMKKKRKGKPERQLVMTIPEAAVRLGISPAAAYRAAKCGEIPTLKLGGLLKVPVVRFERLLNGE